MYDLDLRTIVIYILAPLHQAPYVIRKDLWNVVAHGLFVPHLSDTELGFFGKWSHFSIGKQLDALREPSVCRVRVVEA